MSSPYFFSFNKSRWDQITFLIGKNNKILDLKTHKVNGGDI